MDLKIAARRANVRYELTRIAIGKGDRRCSMMNSC